MLSGPPLSLSTPRHPEEETAKSLWTGCGETSESYGVGRKLNMRVQTARLPWWFDWRRSWSRQIVPHRKAVSSRVVPIANDSFERTTLRTKCTESIRKRFVCQFVVGEPDSIIMSRMNHSLQLKLRPNETDCIHLLDAITSADVKLNSCEEEKMVVNDSFEWLLSVTLFTEWVPIIPYT